MAVNPLIITAVAAVLGFLSGLGIGGGSLLLLWLTLVLGRDPYEARLINLLFFLPSAAVASWFHWKDQSLLVKQILPAALCGCVGAALGSILWHALPVAALKKLFGLLLIVTGIRELRCKPKKQAS